MSQQSICVYAALAINSFACSEPEGMEDTTPLLGMNYSHFIKNLPRSKPKQRNTMLRVQRLLTDGGCGKSGRGRCGKLV